MGPRGHGLVPRGGGVIGVRGGGLVGPGVVGGGELMHRGGGVIGAKWWWVGLEHRGGEVGTYELLFCSKRDAASVVVICEGGGDTQSLQDGKKNF